MWKGRRSSHETKSLHLPCSHAHVGPLSRLHRLTCDQDGDVAPVETVTSMHDHGSFAVWVGIMRGTVVPAVELSICTYNWSHALVTRADPR